MTYAGVSQIHITYSPTNPTDRITQYATVCSLHARYFSSPLPFAPSPLLFRQIQATAAKTREKPSFQRANCALSNRIYTSASTFIRGIISRVALLTAHGSS